MFCEHCGIEPGCIVCEPDTSADWIDVEILGTVSE